MIAKRTPREKSLVVAFRLPKSLVALLDQEIQAEGLPNRGAAVRRALFLRYKKKRAA